MRKNITYTAILFSLLVFVVSSCSKEAAQENLVPEQSQAINAVVSVNGTYQLSLDNTANIVISKQASHFQLSKTETDTKSGGLVYKYVPAENYVGSDEVVLSTTKIVTRSGEGCNGGNHSQTSTSFSNTSYTTIKLNISK